MPKVIVQGQLECGSRPSVATVQDEILSNGTLASYPGPFLGGGEERAWYTLFAHALISL